MIPPFHATPRRRCPWLLLTLCCLTTGCGGKVAVHEAGILDIAILANGQEADAAAVGVRTSPEANQLDAGKLQVVAADGTSYDAWKPASAPTGAMQIGKAWWGIFPVPRKHVDAGGLRLRYQGADGGALPAKLDRITFNDLERR